MANQNTPYDTYLNNIINMNIPNKVKLDELLKYPNFISLMPAIEDKRTDNTRAQLYKKVLNIIENIRDYHKRN